MIQWKDIFNREIYNSLSGEIIKGYSRHRPLGTQKIVYYTPFRSIYFGHHGKAVACCYNRTHILGQYPKQSIKEIWFGQQAEVV